MAVMPESRALSEGMAYVGRAPCGCVRGIIVDDPSNRSYIAKETGKWIRAGLVVERMPIEEARPLIKRCPHEQPRAGGRRKSG